MISIYRLRSTYVFFLIKVKDIGNSVKDQTKFEIIFRKKTFFRNSNRYNALRWFCLNNFLFSSSFIKKMASSLPDTLYEDFSLLITIGSVRMQNSCGGLETQVHFVI